VPLRGCGSRENCTDAELRGTSKNGLRQKGERPNRETKADPKGSAQPDKGVTKSRQKQKKNTSGTACPRRTAGQLPGLKGVSEDRTALRNSGRAGRGKLETKGPMTRQREGRGAVVHNLRGLGDLHSSGDNLTSPYIRRRPHQTREIKGSKAGAHQGRPSKAAPCWGGASSDESRPTRPISKGVFPDRGPA